MSLVCRFYRHKYPKLEDVVMVNVRSVAEMGAYVSLQEYGSIEGMIMLSELTRRRIRSINKLVRIGRSECVAVIRVDEDKGGWSLITSHTHSIPYYRIYRLVKETCVTGRDTKMRRQILKSKNGL